jgi:molybdopterin biosynthesis enzyme
MVYRPWRALHRIQGGRYGSLPGRVTADDVHAPYPLPAFARSTVDGYTVHAADTFGASEGYGGITWKIFYVMDAKRPCGRVAILAAVSMAMAASAAP